MKRTTRTCVQLPIFNLNARALTAELMGAVWRGAAGK